MNGLNMTDGEYFESIESRILRVVIDLGLSKIEGHSAESIVEDVLRVPATYEEYAGRDAGVPARLVTLEVEVDRLHGCVELQRFFGELVGMIEFPLSTGLTYECGDELESSVYLVLVGHYRAACALLRSFCEIVLLDTYFFFMGDDQEWKEGDVYLPSGSKIADKLFAETPAMKSRLKEHIRVLNQYVHYTSARYQDPIYRRWDPEYFARWFALFKESVTLMIATLLFRNSFRGRELPSDRVLDEYCRETWGSLLDLLKGSP
ncbi:hypothetical protein [Alloactinosynnema sp. L-07]|uniref:hypothetical protein n=1 Tax=Alloactinosynnema sp. L-07 TaxID=1653480 RepID=UPI0012F74644|nr:hypothetical protein [Alloactinosynnema sp. L-07]